MKRTTMVLLACSVLVSGWAVAQRDRPGPRQADQGRIVLPQPPFDKDGVEITVRGKTQEPGYTATLLSVHNLHRRITFEIELTPPRNEAPRTEPGPWSVAARLGHLASGTYQVVAVVNGRTVDQKRLKVTRPGGCNESLAWIVYQKSGGIAGIEQTLRVDLESRRFELTDQNRQYEGTLSLRKYLRLAGALLLCNFNNLEPVYKPATPSPDGFTYQVRGPGFTVVGYSGAEIPLGFSYLVQSLDDLVDALLRGSSPTLVSSTPTPTVTPIPATPTPTPAG